MGFRLAPSYLTLEDLSGQKSMSESFDLKFLENGDICEVVTQEHLYVGPTGFRLAPSDLNLDYLEGSKTKVTVFDVKYVENGKSYDVGPSAGYVDSSSLDFLPKIFGLLV